MVAFHSIGHEISIHQTEYIFFLDFFRYRGISIHVFQRKALYRVLISPPCRFNELIACNGRLSDFLLLLFTLFDRHHDGSLAGQRRQCEAGTSDRKLICISVFDIGNHILQIKYQGYADLYIITYARIGFIRCMPFHADIFHGTDPASSQIGIIIVKDELIPLIKFTTYGYAHIFGEILAKHRENSLTIVLKCAVAPFIRIHNHIFYQLLDFSR